MITKIQFATILQILPFIAYCTCKDTIIINQTLKEGELLVSKQNNFALGYFSPGNSSNRYLGIWFYKVPQQAVVWVANRNHPISGSSSGILSINKRGNLVLYSNNNKPIWSTNVAEKATDTRSAEAQLLDTGNFVLTLGGNRTTLWQSFDHPTNTMIPGMKLGMNQKSGKNLFLTSWRSADDPGIGDYSFRPSLSGLHQFYIYKGTEVRWRSGPWPWRTTNQSNLVYTCLQNEDEIYHSITVRDNASVMTIIVLDDSGVLMLQTWNQEQNRWNIWSTQKHRCDLYGLCGANSKCDSDLLNKFECACLPGYEPKSPKDWNLRDPSGGCIRKRLNSPLVCGHGEGFIKEENVILPDYTAAAVLVEMDTSRGRMECERKCKSNCSCYAYASIYLSGKGIGCLTWYGHLIDTRNYLGDIGYDLYVRVGAMELAEHRRLSSNVSEKKGMVLILVLSAALAWFVLIIILVYFWLRRKKRGTRIVNNRRNKRAFGSIRGSKYYENTRGSIDQPHSDLVLFSLSTILAVTANFSQSNKIGQGGFGNVYKGQLANGQEISIKRMSRNSRQGIEEFKNEAMLIAKLQHRNLVRLLGCCIQRKEQMLEYEYMPNKSLDSFLSHQTTKSVLDWRRRFNIIVGIASGISYLHRESRLKIIHRDLKTSNILLDADMNPKISDFGMARPFQDDQLQDKTTRIVGTYGYMSPEYVVFGKFSIKSDVFSFGVIILEIISGKKNSCFSPEDTSLSLIGKVWELWWEGRAMEIVDSIVAESYDPHEIFRCFQVGLLCVQENATDRPTMSEVVVMLKSETVLPSPKQPAFILKASSSNTNSPGKEEGPYSVNEMTISEIQSR